MLELFARHGLFDLEIECRGDLEIDDHHSTEDVAISLGQAFAEGLGIRAASRVTARPLCRWTRRCVARS
jgi:imidazoleglycerol-phosphate dehydratase